MTDLNKAYEKLNDEQKKLYTAIKDQFQDALNHEYKRWGKSYGDCFKRSGQLNGWDFMTGDGRKNRKVRRLLRELNQTGLINTTVFKPTFDHYPSIMIHVVDLNIG